MLVRIHTWSNAHVCYCFHTLTCRQQTCIGYKSTGTVFKPSSARTCRRVFCCYTGTWATPTVAPFPKRGCLRELRQCIIAAAVIRQLILVVRYSGHGGDGCIPVVIIPFRPAAATTVTDGLAVTVQVTASSPLLSASLSNTKIITYINMQIYNGSASTSTGNSIHTPYTPDVVR